MAFASSKQPFLDRLAKELDAEATANELTVVLPNKRSLHVLSAYLSEEVIEQRRIELTTVDDLMQSLSGIKLMEPEELLVTCYHAYKTVEKKPQPFNEFSKWASTFLADVNDVDLHLGDMQALFKQINEYHTIGEGFTDRIGPLETNFRTFWERLPAYYKSLRSALLNIKLGYRGLIYRVVSEQCSTGNKTLNEIFGGKKVCWVGIVPGNPSEQLLLDWIHENATLQVYADVDRYYLENTAHEAGRLFRTANKDITAKWVVDQLEQESYQINLYPVTGNVAQLFRVRKLVEDLSEAELNQTVIVLAEEQMLLPFLEVFEAQRQNLNITAGYPMKNTLIHRFVMTWLKVHSGAIDRNGQKLFYHQNIQDLLEFAVIRNWLGNAVSWNEIQAEIVQRNMKFVSLSWLKSKMEGDLFSEQAFHLIFDWPLDTASIFDRISSVLSDWKSNTSKLRFARIEREALSVYIDRLKQLFAQFNELLEEWDLKELRQFLHRHVGFSKVHFQEPTNDAIQVMGMLETRMVDFKNVIILGAGDDALPGNPNGATHIPFVHRLAHGLPTRKDTEALMSYHFYRLLQRAEKVDMIYNTSAEALSGGESSRFILQIQQELAFRNDNVKIETISDQVTISAESQRKLQIRKTDEVLDSVRSFLSSRVSPSALNTFINSPLEFYYYYVLRLREQDQVEEDMMASTFGSVVHDVLEDIYKPFKGQFIALDELQESTKLVDNKVEKRMLEDFEKVDLMRGRNLIQLDLAKKYVHAFIQHDLEDMKANGPVKVLEIEDQLVGFLEVDGLQVRIMGYADRIDWRNGLTRIVDYKTGKVEQREITTDLNPMFHDRKYSKALQLAFYKWAYCKREKQNEETVESCIYSFRARKNGFMFLQTELGEMTFLDEFEMHLAGLIQDILDPTMAFEHRADSKYVTF